MGEVKSYVQEAELRILLDPQDRQAASVVVDALRKYRGVLKRAVELGPERCSFHQLEQALAAIEDGDIPAITT